MVSEEKWWLEIQQREEKTELTTLSKGKLCLASYSGTVKGANDSQHKKHKIALDSNVGIPSDNLQASEWSNTNEINLSRVSFSRNKHRFIIAFEFASGEEGADLSYVGIFLDTYCRDHCTYYM